MIITLNYDLSWNWVETDEPLNRIIFLDNRHGKADLEPRTKYEVDNYDHLVGFKQLRGFSLSPIDSYFYALPILTL